MSANQPSLSSYGCNRARPGPGFHHFTFFSNVSGIEFPLYPWGACKEVGLVVCLFVVSQRMMLEESVDGESVAVGYDGGNVDRLEWVG